MFDLGLQELIVIFVVALLVFGPRRLPELARTMGKGLGQLRKAMFELKHEVEKEMEDAEDRSEPGAGKEAPGGGTVGEPVDRGAEGISKAKGIGKGEESIGEKGLCGETGGSDAEKKPESRGKE